MSKEKPELTKLSEWLTYTLALLIIAGLFYYKQYFVGFFFLIVAFRSWPNKKVREWINNILISLFYWVLGITSLFLAIWAGWTILKGIASWGNYRGLNAKEWYYAYDEVEGDYQAFRDCVEEYDNFSRVEQINYGSVFNYCD